MGDGRQYCKCIKDTTVQGIDIGKVYEFYTIGSTYCVIYNEAGVTFDVCFGTKEWFYEYFLLI